MNGQIIQICKSGIGTPNLYHSSTEEQLLISAWAYGLKSDEPIHRFSLYSFIQTHLINKTEENLQKTLETNIYWNSLGNGNYSLSKAGQDELDKFGIPNTILSLTSSYSFYRKIEGRKIGITTNPVAGRYED